jgi:eukaryotic-like serine/threonine-protein kinase
MVDSIYQQSFGGAGESPDEDVMVEDDELLVDEQGQEAGTGSRRWSSVGRASRRAADSALRAAPIKPGDVLAQKYVVERIIGRSGPEMVVFGRHVELEQRVRIRYLLPEASASPEAVARFQRGARKAREMRSEHAERVVDFGRLESGSPYRVSELPSGPSLEDILRVRGALDIGEAVDIMVQICEPVAEAHASRVVHRSLCTSNVFVERRADGSLVVKVLDFGVSDSLELSPAGGSVFGGEGASSGALGFASPEQIRNPGAVDARADIWALGAILYELLTGVRVFEAETPLMLLAMIAADQPAPINWLRPEMPPELEAMVFSCLEKDPDRRPRSVVDFANEIAPFGSGTAQNGASRVARMAMSMRTSKPPPLPSSVPPFPRSVLPPTRAIVRSTPAPAPEPHRTQSSLPGWAMMVGGGLMGVCVALAGALALRPQVVAQPAPAAPAPVIAPAPVVVVPTTPATAATAAEAKTPPPARPASSPKPAKKTQPNDERPASADRPPAARVSAASESGAREPATSAPKALFGGIE